VASTKFVAKLASAHCKPDGMLVVPAKHTLDFLRPLPVTALCGVGERTAEHVRRLGIRTVGDLADTPLDALRRALGAASAEHLSALSHGIDPRSVSAEESEKSISAEHTVDEDLTAETEVARQLLGLSVEVGRRVRERGYLVRTIGVKIRFADFATVTRVRTLPTRTDATSTIYETALDLYRGLGLDQPRVRLVGVKCEGLVMADEVTQQLTFDDVDPARTRRPTDAVIDEARRKFGSDAIGYATMLSPPDQGR
jgi:DNA polymerase-4